MSIATLLLWMWMAAQPQHVTWTCLDDMGYPCGYWTDKGPSCAGGTESCSYHTLAEHVIEIRTKRTPNGKTMACSYIILTTEAPCEEIPTPRYCPNGYQCTTLYDTTKTLWVDGQRIGIIREVEEK